MSSDQTICYYYLPNQTQVGLWACQNDLCDDFCPTLHLHVALWTAFCQFMPDHGRPVRFKAKSVLYRLSTSRQCNNLWTCLWFDGGHYHSQSNHHHHILETLPTSHLSRLPLSGSSEGFVRKATKRVPQMLVWWQGNLDYLNVPMIVAISVGNDRWQTWLLMRVRCYCRMHQCSRFVTAFSGDTLTKGNGHLKTRHLHSSHVLHEQFAERMLLCPD